MTPPKRAVVDVDNTLWDLRGPLAKLLAKRHGLPLDADDSIWDWYMQHGITEEQFFAAVNEIHALQMAFLPFPGAEELLAYLDQQGYEVIIASHRKKQNTHILARWLNKNNLLPYSGLYAGSDKMFLIGEGTLVIDDNPTTIEYTRIKLALPVTLAWPWNEGSRAAYRATDPEDLTRWLKTSL